MTKIPTTFKRYVEPFCGSACLFFEIRPQKALLADINFELINALNEIRTEENLPSILKKIPNTEDEYYRIRKLLPENLTNHERAVRFLYLNRFCFNGVYRTNKSGQFNVPRGKNTGDFPSSLVFESARSALKNSELKVSSYEITLTSLKKGDFAYIDPPYSKSGRFTGEYGLGSFDSEQIPEFINIIDLMNEKGVKFLISYRDCDEFSKKLDKKYNVEEISVARHISGFKTTWNKAREIIVTNY